ncbi:unnamed protein product [Caenorhabditis angaria]|uniref:ABC-2 type transporter transmembrane domain-containing protein n=1 Tax=Caenorhabditis angaria TaxID=860376 RepID=A0A9P1MVZ1_9PELO|nr:unnamed protein product [Caenorhabditis angaria]
MEYISYLGCGFSYVGACIFGDEGLVVTFMPMFVLPMLVFGGFYINALNIPKYFMPFSYISWFKHGFEALEENQWNGIDDIPGCGNVTNTGEYCPASNGYQILQRRGITTPMEWNIFILFSSFFVYRFIGMIALNIRVNFLFLFCFVFQRDKNLATSLLSENTWRPFACFSGFCPVIDNFLRPENDFASTVNQYAMIECFASIESTLASEKLESADLRLLSSKNRSNDDFVKLTFQ